MKKKTLILSAFMMIFVAPISAEELKKPDWVSSNSDINNVDKGAPQKEENKTQNWISANQQKSGGSPFKETNYTLSDYSSPGTFTPQTKQLQNGNVLLPEPQSSYEEAKEIISPLSADEINKLRNYFDETRDAKFNRPVQTLPRISSQTVSLSPGASLPIVRTMPYETSTIVFIDSAGAAWPIAAIPRVSNPNAFDVEWLEHSSSVIISAKNMFQQGNLTVFLQGLTSPVVVKLATSDETSKDGLRIVDYRLDLRLPYKGPNSKESLVAESKIGVYDDNLQSFLDGVPPANSKKISFTGGSESLRSSVQIWEFENSLFIRTNLNIQNAFDKTIASSDGTKIFNLPPTPFITLSDGSKKVVLQLNI